MHPPGVGPLPLKTQFRNIAGIPKHADIFVARPLTIEVAAVQRECRIGLGAVAVNRVELRAAFFHLRQFRASPWGSATTTTTSGLMAVSKTNDSAVSTHSGSWCATKERMSKSSS